VVQCFLQSQNSVNCLRNVPLFAETTTSLLHSKGPTTSPCAAWARWI